MNELMQNLLQLQSLDFGKGGDKNAASSIAELRAKIPQQILGHYDRLRARGKKGLAAVRNQVCTECHMSVPLGTVTTIMHGTDIQLCGSCGRYLYLPEPAKTAGPTAVAGRKPAGRPRKLKAALHAV